MAGRGRRSGKMRPATIISCPLVSHTNEPLALQKTESVRLWRALDLLFDITLPPKQKADEPAQTDALLAIR